MKSTINKKQKSEHFKLRGLENTRIESLSDGVFAIAIGLLLISSDPPNTFVELMEFTRNLLPFAGTIAILMWIWYQHYIFFIRFGLRDAGTIAINTVVLFLVLFYAYPLKFMLRMLIDLYQGLITGNQELINHLFTDVIKPEDTPKLMALYGFGGSAIFFVFIWLNRRALKRKQELDLSPVEIQLTKNTIAINLAAGIVPLVSALFAYFEMGGKSTFVISGFMYLAYPIIMPIVSIKGRKKLVKVIASEESRG